MLSSDWNTKTALAKNQTKNIMDQGGSMCMFLVFASDEVMSDIAWDKFIQQTCLQQTTNHFMVTLLVRNLTDTAKAAFQHMMVKHVGVCVLSL